MNTIRWLAWAAVFAFKTCARSVQGETEGELEGKVSSFLEKVYAVLQF
jgi:hypothetical protein